MPSYAFRESQSNAWIKCLIRGLLEAVSTPPTILPTFQSIMLGRKYEFSSTVIIFSEEFSFNGSIDVLPFEQNF